MAKRGEDEAVAQEQDEERSHATPIAMVLHLDDEEEGAEVGEEEDEKEEEVEDRNGHGENESDDDDDDDDAAAAEDDDDDDDDEDEAPTDEDGEDKDGDERWDRLQEHGGKEIQIDVEGRIAGVSDCGLNFNFRSFPTAIGGSDASLTTKRFLSLEALIADCRAAFVGESFWLDANTEPRCALESLARIIFRHHIKDAAANVGDEKGKADPLCSFDPARSGAEWWVQLRHVDDGQSEAVSFHWDKDEDLVDDYGWDN